MPENSADSKFEIDISKPEAEFKEHLALEGNQRIIFSAPFGSGKTFFLKKYFGNTNPLVFHLYPVNYSVSRNEDIFELIKYDLLFQLLDPERGVDFEKIECSLSERASLALNSETANKLLTNFLGFVPKVGKIASAVYENIPKLVEVIAPKHLKDEKRQARKAVREVENTKGSAREFNDLSELIRDLISRTKIGDTEQKSILIIDDLDRIDPEHIFRLLNVFAAHFDINKDENKFGFDKVIFVCDIDNIRRIFATKYGQETDFSGYIDKFYSREVFIFDNIEVVSDSVKKILLLLKPHKELETFFFINKKECFDFQVLRDILQLLVQANQINLRSLLKFVEKEYISFSRPKRAFGYIFTPVNLHLYLVFEFLLKLFGNEAKLLRSLYEIKDHDYFHPKTLGTLLLIIDCRNNHFNSTSTSFFLNKFGNIYTYSFNFYDSGNIIVGDCQSIVEDTVQQAKAQEVHYMKLFFEAAKTLVDLRILK